MTPNDAVDATIKDYILKEFLQGENPDELTGDTPLISSGILDSVATLQLVAFLEKEFNVTLEAHETDAEFLNTIASMARLVRTKRGK